MSESGSYYVPHGSKWPIIATIGVCTAMVGGSSLLNGNDMGKYILAIGLAMVVFMIVGWFSTVISESEDGMYDEQVDSSFRWGMIWFIFSEVMFFAAFFGALFYVRTYSLPWLGGEGTGLATNTFLWPEFENIWPSTANGPGEIGGDFKTMGAWGLPALNTAILLTSGVTLTWAHHALKEMKRMQLIIGLALTVALGAVFMYFQAVEYGHAFNDLNLNMGSGIYGSTFFMLTGFHGFHVTIGTIMLLVILGRSIYGHFNPKNHFAFEAVAWYWHFVDVVWLGLFIFVYWV
ncbi:MAG: cytochrome c oxidase subunit 3 [Gammaproteobacteria bacterium]|jgi:cytochrome c oxidase subunit 3|nr:cytochrome c oxidase subunit 3 [Gammaproteobacteria bacterium]|tara:strand:- start:1276 stop:2145 length:870 start_codon:yes stop_codon:yes gene_type:complete